MPISLLDLLAVARVTGRQTAAAGSSKAAAYWTTVFGNFVHTGLVFLFAVTAVTVTRVLPKWGVPRWIAYIVAGAIAVLAITTALRIDEHFQQATCRHTADYTACMKDLSEPGLPEWEPPLGD